LPLYEYNCAKGHRFEKIESFSAPEKQKCPKCGAKAERALSAPAIQFKGSGWYVTDYAKKSNIPAGESSGDSSAKDSGTKEGGDKAEAAPAKSESTEKKSSEPKAEKSSAKKKK
jgi:putative FmdB family regulatory protein